MEKSANLVKEFKALVHPWTQVFKNQQMETEYQVEVFHEIDSYRVSTWRLVTIFWLGFGFLLLLIMRYLPLFPMKSAFLFYFAAGLILLAWWVSTKSSRYIKFHQFAQVFAYTAVALCSVSMAHALPERYHAPTFAFFLMTILLPYFTANLSFAMSIVGGSLLTVIVAVFSVVTRSYPTAEGGVFFLLSYLFAANLIGVSFYRYRSQQRRIQFLTKQLLDVEKNTSENLLYAIFPTRVADSLRNGERIEPRRLYDVSVVFCDLRGFTAWCGEADAGEVVAVLDEMFSGFDQIAMSNQLDKIKTIGDSYMACSNLSFQSPDAATNAFQFGREAIAIVSKISQRFGLDRAEISLRVGIATGPVIAGVIGTTKPSYDIWGETVNLASRLESSAKPNSIQICERTMKLMTPLAHEKPSAAIVELKGLGATETFTFI